MRQKLLLLFCFGFFFFANTLFAQEKLVTGTVKNEAGDAIPSASVKIIGSDKGTITDANGAFKIGVTAEDKLEFSAINYQTQQITVGDQSIIQVVMVATEGSNLSDVVVTALGIKRSKSNLPYAVQEVGGDQFTETRASNFTNALSGQVAGLQITQNNNLGGSTNVVLRGFKSLTGNNQALFVIDGVPINNSNTNSASQKRGFAGYDYGNAAADINPDDIASVTVLKGAAATALYGSRAANGVILINTKKATKAGIGVSVNFGVTTGSMDRSTFVHYQDQYGGGYFNPGFYSYDVDGDGKKDIVAPTGDDASFGSKFDPNLMVFQWYSQDPTNPNYNKATPWVAAKNGAETFFINPWSNSSSVLVSGSNEKGGFKMGYTRNQDKGIMVNSKIIKDLLNFGAHYKLLDNLTVEGAVDYSRVRGRGRYGNGYGDPSSIASNFREWWQTNVDMEDLKNAYFNNNKTNMTWNLKRIGTNNVPAYWDNPYFSRYENYETDERNRYIGHVSVNYQATPWLNIMGRVSLDHYDELQEERTATGSLNPDGYTRYNHAFSEFNYDLLATVNKDLNEDLSLNALLGGNIRKTHNSSIFAATNGGLVVPNWFALSNSLNPIEAPTETDENIRVNGVFAGATLTYRNFLSLDLSGRNDISSTLPEGNNSYFYGSVSGSFIFSELLKNANWLNHGKLRINYASVGNDAPFASTNDVYTKPTGFGSIPIFTLPNTKNNEDLVPERTNSFELGLNMQMLNNRIGFDVTYYNTHTINQIMPVAISDATGYGFKYVNAGDLQNKGLEVSLNLTPVRNRDFSWDMNINWTRNRSKVLELFGENTNLQLGGGGFQGGVSVNATIGQPYGTLRGSDFVYYGSEEGQTVASAIGKHIILENGDPMVSGSNEVIGNINPDWIGGINNTFKYKNLSLSFLIDMKQGGDVFSIDQWYGQGTGLYESTVATNANGKNIRDAVEDGGGILNPGVTADGQPNTTYATVSGIQGLGYNAMPNKAFVYDASYIKLRSVSIAYNFPQKWFEDKAIKGATFSLFGRNLWIIHKNLPDADPEDAASSGNVQGFQVGSYPTYRMYGFNLNVRF
ncbi:SusC/RagA family TonB-linked outer membrane protein [Arachidicoccus terrestris]|uniref:SusC/RagA family TonB-linked outer membrane protein n=1 Tax=Arachidicoccus terrestris TaxID=2875539 RepID=UPI001CC56722|nr:SusC/RagA family TonB-linked outer membrane protein [Arachidicoccus terrestris]UAY57184.1 SusC/RagA family TonB-linked outer membrane protein [Arachidicoccus terrestris]